MRINFVPCVLKVTGLFNCEISPGAANLISNLLNDLNATLIKLCQEKAASSAMDHSTALHAVMTHFSGEDQRHAVIECGTSLINFTDGLIQYEYELVEHSKDLQKSQIQVPGGSSSLSKATLSAADISCCLKHVVKQTFPRAQMDNEITKNVSGILTNMVEHIAKTSQELGQQKKCLTSLEVQNSLTICFPAQMLIHAQFEGTKCAFHCESGLFPIEVVSKSTESLKRKTPSSSNEKTETNVKTTIAKGKKRTASAESLKGSDKRQKKTALKSGTVTEKIVSSITPNILKTKSFKSKQNTSSKRKNESSSPYTETKKTKASKTETKSDTAKKTTTRPKESSKKKQLSKKSKKSVKNIKEAFGGSTPIQKQEDTEGQDKSGLGTKHSLDSVFKTGAQTMSKNCFNHTLTPKAANEVVLKLQSLFEKVMAQLEQQKISKIGKPEIRQAILIVFPENLAVLALGHMSRTLFVHTNTA